MNTNNKKTNKTINKGVKMNKPKRNIKGNEQGRIEFISLPFAFMSEEVSIIDEMIDLKPFIMVVFVVVVKKVVFDCDIRLNDLNEYMIE